MFWKIAYFVVAFLFFCIRSGNAKKDCVRLNKKPFGVHYKAKSFTMFFQSLVWPLWCIYAMIGEIIKKL